MKKRKILLIYIIYLSILIVVFSFISYRLINHYNKKSEFPIYKTDFIKSSNNPLLSLEMFPNYSGYFDGSSVRIPATLIETNSDGMRDYEYLIKKTEGIIRIAVIGDSYEFGWGVELEDSYPKVLEKVLNQKETKDYEVLNFGIPGYVMYEKIEFLKYKALKYEPDIIIIGLLGNDFGNNTETRVLIEKYTKELKEQNLKSIVKKTDQEIGIEADRIVTKIIREKEKNLTMEKKGELIKQPLESLNGLIAQNITIILLNHVEQPLPEEIIAKLKEYVNKQNNWFLFDCMNDFNLNQELIIPEDGHPNSKAHEIMAETIYNNMKSLNIIS